MPPEWKYKKGAGVGKPPTEILVRWLRLLLEQKVARFKTRLKLKEYSEVSALAFSGDGSRLAVAQASRRPLDGPTPPSPITVFDLATGQPVATMHADYSTERLRSQNQEAWLPRNAMVTSRSGTWLQPR